MAIRFFQRLNRLIQADAHGIIESLEDRALLLKQHLREAEIELQRKRARLETLGDEERQKREDAQRLEEALRALDDDTRLALAGDREDLARFAIRKLLPKRGELSTLHARIDEICAERDRLAPRLEAQEAEFLELRTRVRDGLAAEARAAESDAPRVEREVAEEEVEIELMRRLQPAGGTE